MSNAARPDTAPNLDRKFEQLVETYQKPVLRMCWLCLYDRTLAEDALQETFLKIYRRLDTFRGESDEKTWIIKIAVNTCRDLNRSSWFRFIDRHVTPDALPESAVQIDESDKELTVAVMQLPIRLREVILLY